MGKGGSFTQSRSVGALGSLSFVFTQKVKFLKLLETSRCLGISSITYGIINKAVDVPVCFRNILGMILLPCRIVAIQV